MIFDSGEIRHKNFLMEADLCKSGISGTSASQVASFQSDREHATRMLYALSDTRNTVCRMISAAERGNSEIAYKKRTLRCDKSGVPEYRIGMKYIYSHVQEASHNGYGN